MTGYTQHRDHLRHPRLVDVVRALMLQSGLSRNALAQRCGINRSMIDTILADKAVPNADCVQRVYEELTGGPLIKAPTGLWSGPGGLEQAPHS